MTKESHKMSTIGRLMAERVRKRADYKFAMALNTTAEARDLVYEKLEELHKHHAHAFPIYHLYPTSHLDEAKDSMIIFDKSKK